MIGGVTLQMTSDELRQDVNRCYTHLRRSGWDLAVHIANICKDATYGAWGFATATQWAEADLPTIARNLTHYRKAGEFLLSLPEEEREQWLDYPVWHVIAGERLLKRDPQKLLDVLQSGADQDTVRQAVRADPDLHYETQWRTIHVRVSAPVHEQWVAAMHRAAYEACKPRPTPDDMISCVSSALINEPLYQPPNGFEPSAWYEAVHTGTVVCRECGSKDRSNLTWHHTVSRSSQGHESIQVPLCLPCHEKIQPIWKEWLVKQEFDTGEVGGADA